MSDSECSHLPSTPAKHARPIAFPQLGPQLERVLLAYVAPWTAYFLVCLPTPSLPEEHPAGTALCLFQPLAGSLICDITRTTWLPLFTIYCIQENPLPTNQHTKSRGRRHCHPWLQKKETQESAVDQHSQITQLAFGVTARMWKDHILKSLFLRASKELR